MIRFAAGLSLLGVITLAGIAGADSVTVAVASNFVRPLQALRGEFEARSGHRVRSVAGSTGKLYAQILNGAPYDVFLAADIERPDRLLAAGAAVNGAEFVYAEGVLVLWSPQLEGSLSCLLQLHLLDFEHIAIANEKLAPYGQAASDWLVHRGLWDAVGHRLVRGESVGQAYHFVASGNAQLALVAKAQLLSESATGCRYDIPAGVHEPIRQEAVLLRRGAANAAALEFMRFLRSEAAAELIVSHGYRRHTRRSLK